MAGGEVGRQTNQLCSAIPNLRKSGDCFLDHINFLGMETAILSLFLIIVLVLIIFFRAFRVKPSLLRDLAIIVIIVGLFVIYFLKWFGPAFSWPELFFVLGALTLAISFALATLAFASIAAFLFGAVFATLSRRRFAAWGMWHWAVIKLIGFGHGSALRVQFAVGAIIATVWLFCGVTGFSQVLCPSGVSDCGGGSTTAVPLQIFYDLISTLVPQQGINPLYVYVKSGKGYPALVDLTLVLGPLLTIWVGLPPIIRILIRTFQQFIVRFAVANHYVIVGLGQSGGHLLSNLTADNKDASLLTSMLPRCFQDYLNLKKQRHYVVAALESDAAIVRARGLVNEGTVILDGDGLDEQHYRDLAVHHAAGVHVATGIDSRNVDIAARVSQFCDRHDKDRHDKPTRAEAPKGAFHGGDQTIIVPVVNDRVLLRRMNDKKLFLGSKREERAGDPAIIELFSTDQTAARDLFRDHPIAFLSKLQPDVKRAHLVILGFGNVGEAVALKALQACLYPGLKPPRLSIICKDAKKEAEFFAKRFPWLGPKVTVNRYRKKMSKYDNDDKAGLELGIDIGFYDYDFTFIDKSITELFPKPSTKQPVTAIFICLSDRQDDQNLTAALALQSVIDRTRAWLAPTFVRLSQDTGLIEALRSGETEIELTNIIEAFGLDRKVCTKREVFVRPQRALAANLHLAYRLFSTAADLKSKYDEVKPDTLEAKILKILKKILKSALTDLPDDLRDAEENIDLILSHDSKAWDKIKANISKDSDGATPDQLNAACVAAKKLLSAEDTQTRWTRANVPWEVLPSSFVRSSLSQAEHIPVKLYGLGYRPAQAKCSKRDVGLDDWPIKRWRELQEQAFKDIKDLADIGGRVWRMAAEKLAMLEHTRFMVERAIDGYVWGLKRDNLRKIHPALVTWDALDEIDKKKDFGHILGIKLHLQAVQGSAPRIARDEWFSERLVGFDGLKARTLGFKCMEEVPDCILKKIDEVLGNVLHDYEKTKDTITLVSAANGIGDFVFLSRALDYLRENGWRCQLLIARPLPFDIDMEDDGKNLERWENTRTDILGDRNAAEDSRVRSDSWLVDLLAPGKQHTEFRGDAGCDGRTTQRKLAKCYIRARADVLIVMDGKGHVEKYTKQGKGWRKRRRPK